MDKYLKIWKQMEQEKWYSAADLGLAPATMTALVNRGMVERTNTTPRKYKKIENKLVSILGILQKFDFEFFSVYFDNEELGMLCYLQKDKILDCWGKPQDLTHVNKLVVNKKEFIIS